MPTFTHGKEAEVYISDAGGTERNFSEVCNSISLSIDADVAESSTFGADWKQYVNGLKDATLSLEGRFDVTTDGYMFGLIGGTAVRVRVFPQGSAASNAYYQGSAILTSYEPNADLGDTGNWSAELQFAGTAVTRTVL